MFISTANVVRRIRLIIVILHEYVLCVCQTFGFPEYGFPLKEAPLVIRMANIRLSKSSIS
jgi:hypothetical protein